MRYYIGNLMESILGIRSSRLVLFSFLSLSLLVYLLFFCAPQLRSEGICDRYNHPYYISLNPHLLVPPVPLFFTPCAQLLLLVCSTALMHLRSSFTYLNLLLFSNDLITWKFDLRIVSLQNMRIPSWYLNLCDKKKYYREIPSVNRYTLPELLRQYTSTAVLLWNFTIIMH